MCKREELIRRWFDMWLRQTDLGIDEMFAEDVLYVESWGPQYQGRDRLKHWFAEWNTRGSVLKWEIKQFFHKGDQTVVEWYFQNEMQDGRTEEFDGMSLIVWTPDDRIHALKEFGCNLNCYDPYAFGKKPQFRDEKAMWF